MSEHHWTQSTSEDGTFDPVTEKLPPPKNKDEAIIMLRMALGLFLQMRTYEGVGTPLPSQVQDAIVTQGINANLATHAYDIRYNASRESYGPVSK